jgi:hypothetical protein
LVEVDLDHGNLGARATRRAAAGLGAAAPDEPVGMRPALGAEPSEPGEVGSELRESREVESELRESVESVEPGEPGEPGSELREPGSELREETELGSESEPESREEVSEFPGGLP